VIQLWSPLRHKQSVADVESIQQTINVVLRLPEVALLCAEGDLLRVGRFGSIQHCTSGEAFFKPSTRENSHSTLETHLSRNAECRGVLSRNGVIVGRRCRAEGRSRRGDNAREVVTYDAHNKQAEAPSFVPYREGFTSRPTFLCGNTPATLG